MKISLWIKLSVYHLLINNKHENKETRKMYFTLMQAHVNQTFSCMNIMLGTATVWENAAINTATELKTFRILAPEHIRD